MFIFTQPCILDIIITAMQLLLHYQLLRVEQNGLYFYFPDTEHKCASNPMTTQSSRRFLCIDFPASFFEGGSFALFFSP